MSLTREDPTRAATRESRLPSRQPRRGALPRAAAERGVLTTNAERVPLLWDPLGMAGSERWRKECALLAAESADELAGASPPEREQRCRASEEHGDQRCEGADAGVAPVEGAVVADLS